MAGIGAWLIGLGLIWTLISDFWDIDKGIAIGIGVMGLGVVLIAAGTE